MVRRIDGTTPAVVGGPSGAGTSLARLASDLAELVRALDAIAVPREALADPDLRWYRGDPLATQDDDTRAAIEQCRGLAGLDVDLDSVLAVWDDAMTLTGVTDVVSEHWLHADIAAENLLVRAWALSLALRTFPYYWATMPGRCASRLAVVAAVIADAMERPAHRT